MKKLLIIFFMIPIFGFSQTTEEFDFIAPYSDGYAAIKKGESWGFVNDKGTIAIDFRYDLVLTETNGNKYPVFKNNRCLISEIKKGITYFGYIDKTGNTVIEPKFLNAINFNNNKALALGILKEELGSNDILGKNVVSYRYFEVIIDTDGNVDTYLNPKGINVVLDKEYLKTPPEITSKQISNNLFVVRTKNSKWMIKSIE